MRNNNGACRCGPELPLRLSGLGTRLRGSGGAVRLPVNRQAPQHEIPLFGRTVIVGAKKTLNANDFCFFHQQRGT